MNDHGSMTVEVTENNETRHLVEYASDDLRRTLSSLPARASVPLKMVRIGARSNVWRAVALRSSPSTNDVSSVQAY